LPASYANFLIVNEAVLVPTFGQATDDAAMRTIEAALPGRIAVGVRSEWLVVGLGGPHCLSMQQPRVSDAAR
jgi:agmatine/peptidylarginine deiminase